MEKEFKELITSKVRANVTTLVDSQHARVTLKDFNQIRIKQVGNCMLFYHPVYNNVRFK
jgi:hypothetical protein